MTVNEAVENYALCKASEEAEESFRSRGLTRYDEEATEFFRARFAEFKQGGVRWLLSNFSEDYRPHVVWSLSHSL